MDDVVLHCRPGSAAGLASLLERTETLLASFPHRTPPDFSPWFPATADRHPPIRPARPPPVITCTAGHVSPERHCERPPAETTATSSHESPQNPRGGDVCVPGTTNHILPAWRQTSRQNRRGEDVCVPPAWRLTSRPSPEAHRDKDVSSVHRSWSVFTQRRVLLQSSPSLSKHFHHMVSKHRLHPLQRVRWVISRDNCGTNGDIEQVWCAVSRSVRSSSLPTCNANIQRERAEIWVFCDVLRSEQVGRFLKDELQLTGNISLSVHRLGNVFSM
ncbi:shieldin complex subunit 3 [Symphorus nematophorus]